MASPTRQLSYTLHHTVFEYANNASLKKKATSRHKMRHYFF